jgi:hypothetical protein
MPTTIKPNEHVFIAGRTRSGKTFLAQNYLANYPTVIALDTKGKLNWEEVPDNEKTLITRLEDLPKVKTDKIIYRPRFEELNWDFYEEFFRYCYFRGNLIVWIDEVMSICPTPQKIPEYYKAILTRGAELGVGAWSLSQRPSTIPLVIMSESLHIFCFDLNMTEDRKRMSAISEHPQMLDKPGHHIFWYYNQQTGDTPVKAQLVIK